MKKRKRITNNSKHNSLMKYFTTASNVKDSMEDMEEKGYERNDDNASPETESADENTNTNASNNATEEEEKSAQVLPIIDRRMNRNKTEFAFSSQRHGKLPSDFYVFDHMFRNHQRAPLMFQRGAIENTSHIGLNKNESHRTYVGSCQFDKDGCLFAVSDTKGNIDVYDFEVVLSKWLSDGIYGGVRNCICTKDAYYVHQNDNIIDIDEEYPNIRQTSTWFRPLGTPHTPLLSIPNTISGHTLKWNPHSLNDVAISSRIQNKIQIYDLASRKQVPKRSFNRLSEYQGVNDISFMHSNNDILVAASQDGTLGICDMRVNKIIQKVRLGQNHNKRFNRRAAVSVHSPKDGNLLYATNQDGQIFLYDFRKAANEVHSVNIFDSLIDIEPRKAAILAKSGISSTQLHPNMSCTLSFQTASACIGTIDIHKGLASQIYSPLSTLIIDPFATRLPIPQITTRVRRNIMCYGANSNNLCISQVGVESIRPLNEIDAGSKITAIGIHPSQNYIMVGTVQNHLMCIADTSLPTKCGVYCEYV